MPARYYSPVQGRFLSLDPSWDSAMLMRPQSWNRYTYVLGNPICYTDPDGKDSKDDGKKTIGTILVVAGAALAPQILPPEPNTNSEIFSDSTEFSRRVARSRWPAAGR